MSPTFIPRLYFHAFGTVNALVTLGGAASALIDPRGFYVDLLSRTLTTHQPVWDIDPRVPISSIGAGQMYAILGLIYAVLPRVLDRQPIPVQSKRQIWWWFLLCTLAEPILIFGTLHYLPPGLKNPAKWEFPLHFKMWYTTYICCLKTVYLLGVGVSDEEVKRA